MVYTNIEVNRMKKILVKNQVEGGKVAFELLKESLTAGIDHWTVCDTEL